MKDPPQSEGVLHLEQALRPVSDGEALHPDGQEGNLPEQPHRLNEPMPPPEKAEPRTLRTTDPIKIKKPTHEPTHLRTLRAHPLPIVSTFLTFLPFSFLSLSPFLFTHHSLTFLHLFHSVLSTPLPTIIAHTLRQSLNAHFDNHCMHTARVLQLLANRTPHQNAHNDVFFKEYPHSA